MCERHVCQFTCMCVLAVWRPQIRRQLSYRAEPTCHKPSQTSGVTARRLFPKRPLIFMSISHHFPSASALPPCLYPSICPIPPFDSQFSPFLVLFWSSVLPSSLPFFSLACFWSFLISIHLALQSISLFGQLWQRLLSCFFPSCLHLTFFLYRLFSPYHWPT